MGARAPDKYLSSIGFANWGGYATNPNNCVDDSLNFTIDALGGASNRHPVVTSPISYSGDLEDFGVWYNTLTPATGAIPDFTQLGVSIAVIVIAITVAVTVFKITDSIGEVKK